MMKYPSLILAVGSLIAFGACQLTIPPSPPYAKDTKPHLAKELRVEPKNKTSFKTPEGSLAQGPHILGLMNFSSTWTCVAISLDNSHWLNIATPVGRTCQLPIAQAERCLNEAKFLSVGKVACGKPIEVWLKFRNSQGDIGTLITPYHLIPNCVDKVTVILFGD